MTDNRLKKALQGFQGFGRIFPLLLFLAFFNDTHASHFMGVDINYECINNCTIRVHVRIYRDCTGSNFVSPQPTTFTPQTPGCTAPVALGAWSNQQVTEVTPVCQGWPTQCSTPGALIRGVEEYYFFRDYDICQAGSCVFTISWTDCCRNGAITSGASNQAIYVGSTTLNTTLTTCNNSPEFNVPPVPYICAGQPFTFNQAATDPDGDSLSYSLGPCFQGVGSQITYNAGYSPTAPLGPTWNVNINPTTGDISIVPNPGNQIVGVMCVYVTEWRNGIAINNIVRDIQVTALACPNNNQPSTVGVQNMTGGVVNNPFEVTVCTGTPMAFNLQATDPDVGQVLRMYWNNNIPSASFFNPSNPAQIDTVSGTNPTARFTWTPTAIGTYTILITIQDNSCPIIGSNQFTIVINVIGGLAGVSSNWATLACTDVQLNAFPGISGTGPYTYAWNGSGNINMNPGANTQSFTHTFPGPGTYPYSLTITDSYGCTETVNDSLTVTTGPTAIAGPDISMCSGFSASLGAPPITGQTYQWTPGTGMGPGGTTSPNPGISMNNPGPGTQTVNYQLTVSDGFCNAIDWVRVVVYPTPTPSISGNLNICNGNTTTLTANGGNWFLWSTGDTTRSITVSPQSTTTYTVSVSNNGCASPPVSATVNVSPGPVALVSGNRQVCPGASATLTVVGGTSWQWSTGGTSQTITVNNIQNDTTISVVASIGACSGPPSTVTITVLPRPTADFQNQTACLGLNTAFFDQTQDPTGLATGWIWDFGDPNSGSNNFSAVKNPQHEYTSAGTFNASLIVTSSNGCRDTLTRQVTVNPLPAPDFSFQNVCEGLPVNFSDLTPGNITAWTWAFGNGQTSTQQNPTYTYPAPNAYNVSLLVTDANGCQKVITKTLFVHPAPRPNFSWEHKCFNTITQFYDLSQINDPFGTLIYGWNWNFGQPSSGAGNSSQQQSPTHNYDAGGNYLVSLTAISSVGCSATVTLNVPVENILPLVPVNDTVCQGFGGSPYVINPYPDYAVHWWSDPTSTRPLYVGNQYNTPPVMDINSYYVSLIDDDGCETQRIPINARAYPILTFGATATPPVTEVPNAVVEFTPGSYPSQNAQVGSIMWDFGDGGTSTDMVPVHQYTQPGYYAVGLTIIDIFGCIYSDVFERFVEVQNNLRIWVPNAFSPNGDNKNDEFHIDNKLLTDFSISIFDRWGKLIFESKDVNFRWTGLDKSNHSMPEGVYMYVIRATSYTGEKVEKNGSVTLIR